MGRESNYTRHFILTFISLLFAINIGFAGNPVEFGDARHLCEGKKQTLTATFAERYQQGDKPDKTIQKNLKGVEI